MLFKGRGRRKAVDQGVGGVSSADEESEVERLGDTDDDDDEQQQPPPPPPPPPSRPKLRPFRRGRRRRTRSNPDPEGEGENEGADRDEERHELGLEDGEEEDPDTPKATRMRDDVVSPFTPGAHVEHAELESDVMMSVTRESDRGDVHEMVPSKKRLREDETTTTTTTSGHDRPSTPVDDVHVGRKRVRR